MLFDCFCALTRDILDQSFGQCYDSAERISIAVKSARHDNNSYF
jgi:hypothetical protein